MSMKIKAEKIDCYRIDLGDYFVGEFKVKSRWLNFVQLINDKGEQIIAIDSEAGGLDLNALFGIDSESEFTLIMASPEILELFKESKGDD